MGAIVLAARVFSRIALWLCGCRAQVEVDCDVRSVGSKYGSKERMSVRVSVEAQELHRASVVIDLHTDTLLQHSLFRYDMLRRHRPLPYPSPIGRQVDLPRALGNVTAFGFGVVVNPLSRRPWRQVENQVATFRRWRSEDKRLVFADTSASIRAAHQAGCVAGFLGIEGAHGLGKDLGRVSLFEALDIRYLTLSHFNSNAFAPAAQGWRANNTAPLPALGYKLLDALMEHRVVVDLAHVGRRAFLDAARYCKDRGVPVMVWHTACCSICPSDRNLTDEQLRAVADTGGVVGVIYFPGFLTGRLRADVRCLLPHMRHVRNTFGVDHLALGSDFDGFIASLPRGLQDVTDLPVITQLMLEEGWSVEEIQKVLGENAMRLLDEVRGV